MTELMWVRRNEDKPHRCPECHAVATWDHRRYGPRTKLTCPQDCGVRWRAGRRQQAASNMRQRQWQREFFGNFVEVERPS